MGERSLGKNVQDVHSECALQEPGGPDPWVTGIGAEGHLSEQVRSGYRLG